MWITGGMSSFLEGHGVRRDPVARRGVRTPAAARWLAARSPASRARVSIGNVVNGVLDEICKIIGLPGEPSLFSAPQRRGSPVEEGSTQEVVGRPW